MLQCAIATLWSLVCDCLAWCWASHLYEAGWERPWEPQCLLAALPGQSGCVSRWGGEWRDCHGEGLAVAWETGWGGEAPWGVPFTPRCMQLEVIRFFMLCPGAHACRFHMLLCVCSYRYPFWLHSTSLLPRLKCTLHLLTAIWQRFLSFSPCLKNPITLLFMLYSIKNPLSFKTVNTIK